MDENMRGNFLYLIDKDRTNERWTVCMVKYVGDEDDIIQGVETLKRRRKVWTDDGIEYHDLVYIRANYAGQALSKGEFIIER